MRKKTVRTKKFKGHTTAIGAARLLKRDIKKADKILDAGAGDGFFADYVKEKIGKKVIAVDLEPESRSVKKGDITNLSYPDKSFDLITCMDVIEHLETRTIERAIREFDRLLARGGKLFISTLVNENFSKNACLCPKCNTHFHRIGHLQQFTKQELINKFEKHFDIEKLIITNFSFLSKYPLLERLVRDNRTIKKSKELNSLFNKDILIILKKKEDSPKSCPVCKNRKNLSQDRKIDRFSLIRCPKCNFVYANLSSEEIEEANSSFDDSQSSRYAQYQSSFDKAWFSNIVLKLEKKIGKKGKVLDIGCGNGLLLSEFKKRGWSVSGLDFSPWAKEYAKEIGYKLYTKALEEKLPPKNRYDLVVCTSTLEHIEKPKEFLNHIYKILKPGGIAYFAGMPNYNSILVKLGTSNFEANKPPMHVSYFTSINLEYIIDKTKFSRFKINSYGIPGLYQIYKKTPRTKKTNNSMKKTNNGCRKLLTKIYYYSGRTFGMGDKLEMIIEKNN